MGGFLFENFYHVLNLPIDPWLDSSFSRYDAVSSWHGWKVEEDYPSWSVSHPTVHLTKMQGNNEMDVEVIVSRESYDIWHTNKWMVGACCFPDIIGISKVSAILRCIINGSPRLLIFGILEAKFWDNFSEIYHFVSVSLPVHPKRFFGTNRG